MSTPNSTSLKRTLPTASSAQANPSTPANTTTGNTPRSIATPNAHHPAGLLSPATTRTSLGKSPKPPTGTPSAAKSSFPSAAPNSAANTPQVSSSQASKHLPPGSSGPSQGSPAALVATPGLSATGTAGTNGAFGSPGIHDALGMGLSMSSMGVAMGLSASSLGLGVNMNLGTGSSMGPGKMGDNERRRRLEAVLALLGQRTGHVSQAGLEQLGKRFGLDLAWDLFPDLKVGNGRMLSLSGVTSMQVDVEFEDKKGAEDAVARVALTYHGLSEAVEAGARPASRILHRDVVPSKGQAAITLTLDRFAANLERLSRLDKLSVPGANCFEAINGVYTSLKTLYEHEKKAARTLLGDDVEDERVSREVLCKKSGRPRMHVRRHVGLQLDYWQSRHLVPSGKKKEEPSLPASVVIKTEVDTPMAMDIDGAEPNMPKTATQEPDDADDADQDSTVYSLSIECEHSPPASLYQTIRVSSDWLSEHISRRPSDVESALAALDPLPSTATATQSANPQDQTPELQPDWQDPPFPHDPSTAPAAATAAPGAEAKPSQARFTAKLHPPLLVPMRIAIPIYASVGVDISHEVSNIAWHAAILEQPAAPLPTTGSPFRVAVDRALHLNGPDTPLDVRLQLAVPRAEPARLLESIPFVHPKQLVALLPVLRQYALLAGLLRQTFVEPVSASASAAPSSLEQIGDSNGVDDVDIDVDIDTFMADDDDDDDDNFTDQAEARGKSTASLLLATDFPSGPRFAATLPVKGGVAYADVDVLPGGELRVGILDCSACVSKPKSDANKDAKTETDTETNTEKGTEKKKDSEARGRGLASGLAVAEDFGVWAAWARRVL